MAVLLSPLGGAGAQFFDDSGNPLTGGKIFTYGAGTTTPQASYTTSAGNVAHTNPIVLDAAGRVPSGGEIWLTEATSYKFVLKTSADVLIATYDNITGVNNFPLPIDATDVTYDSTTVQNQLDTIGATNTNAWGVIKQNTSDYATRGANILPAFANLTKVNFDPAGNHSAGTVGTITGAATGAPFSYFLLELDITTTTAGYIKLLKSGSTIFGDLPEYYFSNAGVLNDAGENNQYVTTDQYYFYIPTDASGFSNISIETDTLWAGQVSAMYLYPITGTKFAIGGCGSEANGPQNPVGLKAGAYNRNDMAIGNKYTLGLMSYDGVLPIAAQNVAMGSYALASNWKGDENTAYGTLALAYNEGSNNVAVGYSALKFNTKGQENVAVGYKAGSFNTTGYRNTFVGMWSGAYNRTGINNTRVGWSPIIAGGLSSGDTSMGAPAGTAVLTGGANCFYGANSGVVVSGQATLNLTGVAAFGYNSRPWGNYSIAIGFGSVVGAEGAFADNAIAIGYNASAPKTNTVAIGTGATVSQLLGTAVGYTAAATEAGTALGYNAQATGVANSIAVGRDSVATGEQAVVVGPAAQGVAYRNVTVGSQAGIGFNGDQNTFLGGIAGVQAVTYTNCTLLGYGTAVSGSNQVQLGNASTTTYAYGAVQNRSDARDKTEVRPTVLGLDFINALNPVDFKWDMRDDYFDLVEELVDGKPVTRKVPLAKDGSRKRTRFHHGLIAQEVKAACDAAGVDFGGYQDHSVKGGDDVLSLGYEELIAPLIKAVQQLSQEVAALKAKV